MSESFRQRFLKEAGDRPYAWAAKHDLPKGLVIGVLRGDNSYTPINRTFRLLAEKTGKSENWWRTGKDEEPAPSTVNQEQVTHHTEGNVAGYAEQPQSEKAEVIGQIVAGRSKIDKELLAAATQALEEFLEENHLEIKPEKKGAVIAFMYDYMASDGDADAVIDMLKAVL